jgi:hypothetical protein
VTNLEGNGVEPWQLPEISVRLHPFNWVLEGRLGVELEVAIATGLSVEVVPVFVTSGSPPTLNLAGRDDISCSPPMGSARYPEHLWGSAGGWTAKLFGARSSAPS